TYGMKGETHWNWKGGISGDKNRIRASSAYKFWRKAVFQRDNWTCVKCGQWGGYLEADHIKGFAEYPELRFEVSNGQTLCKPCHRQITNERARFSRIESNTGVSSQYLIDLRKKNEKCNGKSTDFPV